MKTGGREPWKLLPVMAVAFAAFAIGCGNADHGGDGTIDAAGDVGTCKDPGENAHVEFQSGTCAGLATDNREGTPPPAAELTDLSAAAKAAGCVLREDLPEEGNNHVDDSTPVVYKTNPPTSGDHNPVPIADGAYVTPLNTDTSKAPNVRSYVHSLEHGRIEIQYGSDLPQADQLALKGIFDSDSDGMLIYPNDEMPYQVAATAWTALLGCPKYSSVAVDAIIDFRDKYRGNGPEAIPIAL